jgi:uncharacterized protein
VTGSVRSKNATDLSLEKASSSQAGILRVEPSRRTRVVRHPERGVYDRGVIDAILDEGLFCHLAFVHDGQPYAIPTLYARVDDRIYVHGSSASRMLGTLAEGAPVCLTVTLIDGLVLARSVFQHSANYRSVVVLGAAERPESDEEKRAALMAFVDHILPGRAREFRAPTAQELKATSVLVLPIAEASAKVRTGGPLDLNDREDVDAWTGVLPLRLQADPPQSDEGTPATRPLPSYLRDFFSVRRAAGAAQRAAEERARLREAGP